MKNTSDLDKNEKGGNSKKTKKFHTENVIYRVLCLQQDEEGKVNQRQKDSLSNFKLQEMLKVPTTMHLNNYLVETIGKAEMLMTNIV